MNFFQINQFLLKTLKQHEVYAILGCVKEFHLCMKRLDNIPRNTENVPISREMVYPHQFK